MALDACDPDDGADVLLRVPQDDALLVDLRGELEDGPDTRGVHEVEVREVQYNFASTVNGRHRDVEERIHRREIEVTRKPEKVIILRANFELRWHRLVP